MNMETDSARITYVEGRRARIIYKFYSHTNVLITIQGMDYVAYHPGLGGIEVCVGDFEYDSMFNEGYVIWVKDGDSMEDVVAYMGEHWRELGFNTPVPLNAALVYDDRKTYLPGMAMMLDEELKSFYQINHYAVMYGWDKVVYPTWKTILSGEEP